ncbi:MAG: LURP-one-related family protein, partial [Candidatus Izemoplasmataceae bacterium]
MKFYIKPNHFAQYRSFKIRNETEGELFKIKGKFFMGLRSLRIKDMSGQVLYTVKRRMTLRLHRVYSVHNEIGEEVARIHRTFGSKKPSYKLYMKEETVHFEGSLIDHTFSINDNDN